MNRWLFFCVFFFYFGPLCLRSELLANWHLRIARWLWMPFGDIRQLIKTTFRDRLIPFAGVNTGSKSTSLTEFKHQMCSGDMLTYSLKLFWMADFYVPGVFCSNSAYFTEILLVCDGPSYRPKNWPTQGGTDRRTDTPSYRDASKNLRNSESRSQITQTRKQLPISLVSWTRSPGECH